MAEYITKEQALQAVRDAVDAKDEAIDAVGMRIDALTVTRAAHITQGHWIESDHGSYVCSACGEDWVLNDGNPEENHMNYCPRCGARMDGALDGR